MTQTPNPAEFARQQREIADREKERVVRKRRKMKRSAHIASHVDEATLSKLAKVALPDADAHRTKGGQR